MCPQSVPSAVIFCSDNFGSRGRPIPRTIGVAVGNNKLGHQDHEEVRDTALHDRRPHGDIPVGNDQREI